MNSFSLFFLGAEAPAHRKSLLEAGVKNVGLSFSSLRPRLPKTGIYKLKDKYPEDTNILLVSGSAQKEELDLDQLLIEYHDLVQLNMERLTYMVEFDHHDLTKEMVDFQRKDFWDFMDEAKFVPIWRPQFGMDELDELCERYPNVAIPASAFDLDVNFQPVLNRLVAKTGVHLHALGMTQPDPLLRIHFSSASTVSWTAPARYGSSVIWDGTKLRNYPVSYQEQARRRHRMLFERAGFDAEKIANGEAKEVGNFTIWSYLRFEEWLQKHRQMPTDSESYGEIDTEHDDVAGDEVDERPLNLEDLFAAAPATRPLPVRHVEERPEGERKVLPVFGQTSVTATDDKGEQAKEVPVLTSLSTTLRQCAACHVAASCPAFKPESTCAYELPVEIRTKSQLSAAMSTLVEIQMSRIAFMRFAEDLEGGYPDKNLSVEMGNFFSMVKAQRDIMDNRETFKMNIEARTNAGVISRLFGDHVGEAQKALPEPIDTNELMEVFDAEVVDS